jgi:hypothetical protein
VVQRRLFAPNRLPVERFRQFRQNRLAKNYTRSDLLPLNTPNAPITLNLMRDLNDPNRGFGRFARDGIHQIDQNDETNEKSLTPLS